MGSLILTAHPPAQRSILTRGPPGQVRRRGKASLSAAAASHARRRVAAVLCVHPCRGRTAEEKWKGLAALLPMRHIIRVTQFQHITRAPWQDRHSRQPPANPVTVTLRNRIAPGHGSDHKTAGPTRGRQRFSASTSPAAPIRFTPLTLSLLGPLTPPPSFTPARGTGNAPASGRNICRQIVDVDPLLPTFVAVPALICRLVFGR